MRRIGSPKTGSLVDRLNQTARSGTGVPYRTLQDIRNTRPTKPRMTARPTTFVRPTRTTIFENEDEASSFYGFQKIEPDEKAPLPDHVAFTNPVSDEFASALAIIFVASNFDFYRVLSQNDVGFARNGVIDVAQVLECMKMMSPVQDEESEGASERVCNFVALCKFVGFSIQGAHEISDYDTARTLVQSAFDSERTEDIVFDVKTRVVPPETIEVKSKAVEQATFNESSLSIYYRPFWGIAKHEDRFVPLIVRSTGEVDAFYGSKEHNRFGSLKSLVYSGLSILFVCYSLRNAEFPAIA